MKKLATLIGLSLFISCGSDHQDENGVIPIEVPSQNAEKETPKPEENRTSEDALEELLNVRMQDGSDTSMVFDRIPIQEFGRFRYRKLMLEFRDDYWVLTHPDFEFKMAEIEFSPELNRIQYSDPDSTVVDKISGHRVFGTGGEIPKTEFARLTFTPTGGDLKNIPEPATHDLYNIQLGGEGRNGNPQAYRLQSGSILMTLKGGSEGNEYMALFMFDESGELLKRRVEYIQMEEEGEE